MKDTHVFPSWGLWQRAIARGYSLSNSWQASRGAARRFPPSKHRLFRMFQGTIRVSATKHLATEKRATIYRMWHAAQRAGTQQAEQRRALISVAVISHEAPQGQQRHPFGHLEDMLISSLGNLAQVPGERTH